MQLSSHVSFRLHLHIHSHLHIHLHLHVHWHLHLHLRLHSHCGACMFAYTGVSHSLLEISSTSHDSKDLSSMQNEVATSLLPVTNLFIAITAAMGVYPDGFLNLAVYQVYRPLSLHPHSSPRNSPYSKFKRPKSLKRFKYSIFCKLKTGRKPRIPQDPSP